MSKQCLLIPTLWGDFNLGLERTMSMIASGLVTRGHSVEVGVRYPIDVPKISETFAADLRGVKIRQIANWGRSFKSLPVVGRPLTGIFQRWGFQRLTAAYDVVIVQSGYVPLPSRGQRSILFTEFPRDVRPTSRDWQQRLASYDLIIGNSEFTSAWIDRYWHCDSAVFYPSVQECKASSKQQTILGVGRFTRGGREKGQLEMIDTFRKMVDGGLRHWKLQLAGLPGSLDYLQEARRRSRGYPIEIMVGSTAEELANLYGRASIFWHTTGLGVDQTVEPQRLEHFGIVVAEAMTAGCVPLVFDAAGPKEIVANPELRWCTLEQLRIKTQGLIDQPDRMRELSAECRRSAVRRFGERAFDRSLDRLLSE